MELKTVVVKQVVQQNVIQQTPASNNFRFLSYGTFDLISYSDDTGWGVNYYSVPTSMGGNVITIGTKPFIYDAANNKFISAKTTQSFGAVGVLGKIVVFTKGNELRYRTYYGSKKHDKGGNGTLLLKVDSKNKTFTFKSYGDRTKGTTLLQKKGRVVFSSPRTIVRNSGKILCVYNKGSVVIDKVRTPSECKKQPKTYSFPTQRNSNDKYHGVSYVGVQF